MNEDILIRLRAGVQNDGYDDLIDEADALMKEAAAEIEKLRGELEAALYAHAMD